MDLSVPFTFYFNIIIILGLISATYSTVKIIIRIIKYGFCKRYLFYSYIVILIGIYLYNIINYRFGNPSSEDKDILIYLLLNMFCFSTLGLTAIPIGIEAKISGTNISNINEIKNFRTLLFVSISFLVYLVMLFYLLPPLFEVYKNAGSIN